MKLVIGLLAVCLLPGLVYAGDVLSPDDVLFKWRNQELTVRDFENEVERIPEADRFEFRLDQGRIDKMLDNMLIRRALATEALAAGLERDKQVKIELERMRESILAKARMIEYQKNLPTVDFAKAAKEYYTLHKTEFMMPERVLASHVLIMAKSRTDEEAKKLAEDVRQQALAGADFAELAVKYSDEPGAERRKGNLGFFTRGQMVKPFEDVAFAMEKPGEISAVTKTEFGYHVIRLEAHEKASLKPFESVKDELVNKIKSEYENDRVADYVSSLRSDKSLVKNVDLIGKLKSTLSPEMKAQIQ